MVRQRAKAHKQVEDTSWIPKAVEVCRDMQAIDAEITTYNFAEVYPGGLTVEEAEQRLRKLTQNGFLHMSAARSIDGSFRAFVWVVR